MTNTPSIISTPEEMLSINKKRNSADPFNPVSGRNAGGKRRSVYVEGLNPARQYIPKEMFANEFVSKIVEAKNIDIMLPDSRSLSGEAIEHERELLRGQWNRIRSRHDFPFWAATFIKIKNKDGDITPFRLNAPQRKLVNCFEDMRLGNRPIRLVLLKARQWGGSTATQLYMSWIQLMHRKAWNSLIVGHQSSSAAEVNSMFELMMEHYPQTMLYEPGETYNRKEPKLANLHGTTSTRVVPARNVKIKLGTAERPHSVRSCDSSMVHCTEVAYWKLTEGKTPTQMMKSATSGVLNKPLTMIVYESSANGVGNFFHKEYLSAKNGDSQFKALFVGWHEIELYRLPFTAENAPAKGDPTRELRVPRFATAGELAQWLIDNRSNDCALSERTESGSYFWRLWEMGASLEAINWYIAERTKYTDSADMASEFPSDDVEAFSNSGERVFRNSDLDEMRKACSAPRYSGELHADAPDGIDALCGLHFEKSPAGQLKIWRMPEADNDDTLASDRYVVTVDIGGRSKKADWSVIWVADRAPMLHGGATETVAQWRGHIDIDKLAWKAAQIAQFYNEALLVIESNTIETNDSNRRIDGDQSPYIFTLLDSVYPNLYRRPNGKPGFHTNIATKPMVISALIHAVRDRLLDERNEDCINEMACYERRPNGSYGAIIGEHDDILMTRAIGMYVSLHEMSLAPTCSLTRHKSTTFLFEQIQ